MDKYALTVVTWPFDKIFPGNLYIWGDFQNAVRGPEKRCVGEIRMEATIDYTSPDRLNKDHRLLKVSVAESFHVMPNIHTNYIDLTKTPAILAASVTHEAPEDVYFKLEKGESVKDGAIRIALWLFELVNLRGDNEPLPFINSKTLAAYFSVRYKSVEQRRIGARGNKAWRSEGQLLREKHGLKLLIPNIAYKLD